MAEPKTRTFMLKIWCMASYKSCLEVPAHMTYEEAVEYAKEHLNEAPLGVLDYVPDSDELDDENCGFAD